MAGNAGLASRCACSGDPTIARAASLLLSVAAADDESAVCDPSYDKQLLGPADGLADGERAREADGRLAGGTAYFPAAKR